MLAAKNFGLSRVILPKGNEPDVAELKKDLVEGLQVLYVEKFEQDKGFHSLAIALIVRNEAREKNDLTVQQLKGLQESLATLQPGVSVSRNSGADFTSGFGGTQISIAGRMLVFLPQDNHIGVSQKIGSAEARDQRAKRPFVLR